MVRQACLFLILSSLLAGCTLFSATSVEPQEEYIPVYPEPDFEMAAMLESYRDSLNSMMNRRIAMVSDTVRFGKPEGALGNLVADALRFTAARETREFVHIGIIGESSFRLFLEPGILTLGEVYEFMPYENNLVVLDLNGVQVIELSHQIAALGGAPVSGIRMSIRDDRAAGILVNAESVDPERVYRVATTSFLAGGGDLFPALWDPVNRQDLELSARDLFVQYFQSKVVIDPVIDGRIRK